MIDYTPPPSVDTLANLQAGKGYYNEQKSTTNIRAEAIRDVAQSLGMQAGLAAESIVINAVLEDSERQLDRVFTFNLLLYRDNVLPPVLEDTKQSVEIDHGGNSLRVGGETYRIIKQVRFVSTSPSWRDYLWMNYPTPSMPAEVLLPKNSIEKAAWVQGVEHGYKMGRTQAIDIYKVNLNRLVRDFNGMVLYKKLLMKNMISPFEVEKTDLGVTGSEQKLVVDDQAWRITSRPALQVHSQFWQPVMKERTVNSGDPDA